MKRLGSLVAVFVVLVSACTPREPSKDAIPQCPESQKCLTKPYCDYDPHGKCELCRCSPPPYSRPEATPPK